MLVRTPPHKPYESLNGFVLRVSEANGYDTPWHVLSHAGFDLREMKSAGFPIAKLAYVLGITADVLAPIAYSGTTLNGEREYRLLGHSLGRGLSYKPLRLTKPSFCPHCVEEQGYIDAFFDLRLAVACPIHHRTLVSQCPACGKSITWFRPGIMTCKCGASLSDATTNPVSPALSDLMAVLWAKSHCLEVNPEDFQSRIPAAHLLGMPLRVLLQRMPELGRLSCLSSNTVTDSVITMVSAAADTLANWPIGFRQFLSRMGATVGDNHKMLGYRKQFEHFYQKFFKERDHRNEFRWMRDEFVRFGLEEYGNAIIDGKLLRGEQVPRRFVTKAELARKLNVSPVTLRKWGEKGLIELKVVPTESQTRYIADLTAYDAVTTPPSDSAVLKVRAAAAYLGVPVRVLQRLRKIGRLPGQYISRLKAGYRATDLDGLRAELLAQCPVISAADVATMVGATNVVDLATVLRRMRFHDDARKTDFVLEYLAGGILPVGRSGDALTDILFRKADVEAFAAASRAAVAGGLTLQETAALIGCDVRGVPGLISEGLLCPVPGNTKLRVTRESVERFAEQYVPLSAVAANLDTRSKRLRRLSQEGGVPLLLAASTHAGPVPFIARHHICDLRSLSEASPARRPREEQEPNAVKVIRLYLESLSASGTALPRKGTKPLRSAIAAACGLDRSVFYTYPAVVAMVEDYAKMEDTSAHLGVLGPAQLQMNTSKDTKAAALSG